jgi:allantoinase
MRTVIVLRPRTHHKRVALVTLFGMASSDYPRDLIGYGAHPPSPRWPDSARIAVQFVLNYEEGGEANILHGDSHAENYLHEVVGSAALPASRNLQIESVYEYGSRVGVWRVLRLAQEFGIPLTIFAVAMALERHPALARELVGLGHEIASHGWRWIDYHTVPEEQERADMRRAIEVLTRVTGARPLGWYTGRLSPNTRRLVVEEGCTTRTPTTMICPTGSPSPDASTWWCRTPWTSMT